MCLCLFVHIWILACVSYLIQFIYNFAPINGHKLATIWLVVCTTLSVSLKYGLYILSFTLFIFSIKHKDAYLDLSTCKQF